MNLQQIIKSVNKFFLGSVIIDNKERVVSVSEAARILSNQKKIKKTKQDDVNQMQLI